MLTLLKWLRQTSVINFLLKIHNNIILRITYQTSKEQFQAIDFLYTDLFYGQLLYWPTNMTKHIFSVCDTQTSSKVSLLLIKSFCTPKGKQGTAMPRSYIVIFLFTFYIHVFIP